MARRKKTSPAEEVIAVVALVPWWVGLLLALAAYVWLHHVATQPDAPVTSPAQIGANVMPVLGKALARIGQYVLPLLCLIGAGLSAVKRYKRTQLVADAATQAPDALNGISWQEFEQLVGEAFRLKGYQVSETGGGGPDGGVDLVLRKDGETFLVQCKQWRAYKVGVNVVRELYGAMAAKGAAGGFVVTSGRFTEEAKAFAQGRNVKLLDGGAVHALIKLARGLRGEVKPASPKLDALPAATATATATVASAESVSAAKPSCPSCGKEMVARVAKRGASAGEEFWGCTGYPSCRGTQRMA